MGKPCLCCWGCPLAAASHIPEELFTSSLILSEIILALPMPFRFSCMRPLSPPLPAAASHTEAKQMATEDADALCAFLSGVLTPSCTQRLVY
eukprot:3161200-Pleurochrysis_carterae.AAC.2